MWNMEYVKKNISFFFMFIQFCYTSFFVLYEFHIFLSIELLTVECDSISLGGVMAENFTEICWHVKEKCLYFYFKFLAA